MFFTIAALVAAQAGALDPDVACVVDRIHPSARAAVLAEAGSGQNGPVRQAFIDAGAACAQERSWSPDFAANVGMRAAGLVVREEATAALSRQGIGVAPIDRWIDALPPAQRNMDNLPETSMDQLFEMIVASGVERQTVEFQAATIGLYIGARFAEMAIAEGGRP